MEAFQKLFQIVPHYITYEHPWYDATSRTAVPGCYGAGKYCVSPGFFQRVKNPEIIIEENLAQKCIYLYAEKLNDTSLYTDYLMKFSELCLKDKETTEDSDIEFTKECGMTTLLRTSIPVSNITSCVYNSFEFTGNYINVDPQDFEKSNSERNLVSNRLLDQDNDHRKVFFIRYLPSILVNQRVFWGNWNGNNLYEAVCAGFAKKPSICYELGAFSKGPGIAFPIFVIVCLTVFISIVIFLICRKQMQININSNLDSSNFGHKINTVVTSYLSMNDQATISIPEEHHPKQRRSDDEQDTNERFKKDEKSGLKNVSDFSA